LTLFCLLFYKFQGDFAPFWSKLPTAEVNLLQFKGFCPKSAVISLKYANSAIRGLGCPAVPETPYFSGTEIKFEQSKSYWLSRALFQTLGYYIFHLHFAADANNPHAPLGAFLSLKHGYIEPAVRQFPLP